MSSFVDRVLASTNDNPAPYLRNQNLVELFPTLMQDVSPMPEYCFPNWLPESYSFKSLQRVFREHSDIQFYFGGTGGAFPVLHYDVLATHAYLFQIYGRKKFIVFAPDQTKSLPVLETAKLFGSQRREAGPGEIPRSSCKAKATTFILEPGRVPVCPQQVVAHNENAFPIHHPFAECPEQFQLERADRVGLQRPKADPAPSQPDLPECGRIVARAAR